MKELSDKLEGLANKMLDDIKTSPVKTLLWSLLVVYLVLKIVKMARR